ncbi:hypothetical protein ACFWXA_30775 [Streptomyces atroolivaceus]|uniref:hypothetical protein n=1 Tax=Streptomyces atroolivaceus TaxID=66869 RepID=UPI0036613D8A
MADTSTAPLGHSVSAHRVHGWCSHCRDHGLAEEVAAWRMDETDRHAAGLLAGSDRPPTDLVGSGLLWLINRTTFHPRGLALALRMDEGGTQVLGWQLVRAADGEPFEFPADVDRDGFQRAEATLRAALHDEER